MANIRTMILVCYIRQHMIDNKLKPQVFVPILDQNFA